MSIGTSLRFMTESSCCCAAHQSNWSSPSPGELLVGFFRFYTREFNWRQHAVCMCLLPPQTREMRQHCCLALLCEKYACRGANSSLQAETWTERRQVLIAARLQCAGALPNSKPTSVPRSLPTNEEQWYLEDPFDLKHNLAGHDAI